MKIKALAYFQDGTIFAAPIEVDQVVEVTQREYELVLQSGGDFEVLDDSAEATPEEAFQPKELPGGALLTPEQFAAKQLKDKQEFEAKQKKEKEDYDASAKVKPPKFNLHLTRDGNEEQATKDEEERARQKLAEKRAKEAQEELDAVAREVAKPEKKVSVKSK